MKMLCQWKAGVGIVSMFHHCYLVQTTGLWWWDLHHTKKLNNACIFINYTSIAESLKLQKSIYVPFIFTSLTVGWQLSISIGQLSCGLMNSSGLGIRPSHFSSQTCFDSTSTAMHFISCFEPLFKSMEVLKTDGVRFFCFVVMYCCCRCCCYCCCCRLNDCCMKVGFAELIAFL